MIKPTPAVATESSTLIDDSERSAKLQIRCTAAEKLAWESLAKDAKLTLSDLVRQRMGRKMRKTIPHHDPALIRQLAGIGNNLNQITVMVRLGKMEKSSQLLDIITQIKHLMSETLEAKNHAAD